MIDRTSFRSGLLPVEHFERRFAPDNLHFWAPLLVELGRIDAATAVLDVGCGTGGFTHEIAPRSGAHMTGCDVSPAFVEVARAAPAPATGP